MELLLWVTTILMVVGVGGVAMMKLANNKEVIEQANRLGYEHIRKSTGVAELVGVAGIVVGAASSSLTWLGIAAAVGIAAMMIGAIVLHRRAGDTWPTMPSLVMLISAVLYIVAVSGT